MTCKKCKAKRKRSRVGAANSLDLDFKGILLMGAGALAGALANNAVTKIVKPTGDSKKDATRGIMVGLGKALLGGYLAYSSDDETVEKLATGFAAEGGLESAMYLVKVPVAAYPTAIKGIGVGASVYYPQLDPMNPQYGVSGYGEAMNQHAVAGGVS